MTNTKPERLFAEFPAITTEQWDEVITKDLKGADYERKLVWKTPEGIKVRPYYRAEDLSNIQFLGGIPGEFPFVRGIQNHNRWRVSQSVVVDSVSGANAEALDILMKGVDSVCFILPEEGLTAESLNELLSGISLVDVEVTFKGKKLVNAANLFIAKVKAEGLEPKAVRACFDIDPIVKNLSVEGAYVCGGKGEACFEAVAELVKATEGYNHIKVVTVGADYFSNAGSTIVEELAFGLSAGHEYIVRLMELGLSIEQIGRKVRFAFSITSNYFMELAKFRAARMLWANIVKGYSPECLCVGKMVIHATTSQWNQTVYDPYVNMLRGTTEAMSAALAGVQSLEVLPFNAAFETPDEFSKRIARNVEALLKHESHFDQVVDPAGGSYYIENLTQSVAAEAWKLFLEIEEKGGYAAAFEAGFIVERVSASAASKDKNIATRRQILLGANQYPNFTESAGDSLCACAVSRDAAEGNVLTPYRGAMAFEAMRLGVDRSGKEPKAFMLTCGNLGMARARSQFACNFFACAGIKVMDNTYFKSVEEGVEAAKASGAQIVVVCSSDDDYATVAPQIKELLGASAILVVAGAPACAPELEAQGIGNFINVKSNVLETLKFYLKEMGI
ncbi:MAG: methylmalonyl-CoA mutase family protein [Rikenellaceae bacterium]